MTNGSRPNQASSPWDLILRIPKWILVMAVILVALVFIGGFVYSVMMTPCEVTSFGLTFGPKRECAPMLPSGTILPYYGPIRDIPEGWSICGDKTKGTPNLNGRFLIGTSAFDQVLKPTGSDVHHHEFSVTSERETPPQGIHYTTHEGVDNGAGTNTYHQHMVNGDTQKKNHIPPSTNVLFLCKE